MDVVLIRLCSAQLLRNQARLLRERAPSGIRRIGDARHPFVAIAREGHLSIRMERTDDPEDDAAVAEAADLLEHCSESPFGFPDGPVAVLLRATELLLQERGRRADVHAPGPWLPMRLCPTDGGPPPFDQATLAAWSGLAPPSLIATSHPATLSLRIMAPQLVAGSKTAVPTPGPVDLMRTVRTMRTAVQRLPDETSPEGAADLHARTA